VFQQAVTIQKNYWNSGNQDNQYPSEQIQGTFDRATGNIRRNLMILPFPEIQSALSGASLNSAFLRVRRMATTHGSSGGATIRIHSHGATSIIGSWTGTGLTFQTQVSLTRGQEEDVPLPPAVSQGLQSGGITGLAFSTTSTNIAEYARMDAGRTRITINYFK
jgi:hypothetical protein